MITFRGRVGRGRFALLALFCWLAFQAVVLAGSVPTYVLVAPKLHDPVPSQLAAAMPEGVAGVLLIVSLLAMLVVAVVGVSLVVRRFHDINLTGWLAVPYVLAIAFLPTKTITDYLPTTTALICFIALAAVPGAKSENKFGARPSGDRQAGGA